MTNTATASRIERIARQFADLYVVAAAAALLTRERVLSEEGYAKCLNVWIDKHARGSGALKAIARSSMSYAAVVATLPPMERL